MTVIMPRLVEANSLCRCCSMVVAAEVLVKTSISPTSVCLIKRPRPNARCQPVERRLWTRELCWARQWSLASLAFGVSYLGPCADGYLRFWVARAQPFGQLRQSFFSRLLALFREDVRTFWADITRVPRGVGDAYDIEKLICSTLWRNRFRERQS